MPEAQIVETLIEQAMLLAEQAGGEGAGTGRVQVDVR